MRLLSWIFQPAYLIFFAMAAALYIYREEVIPEHRDIEQGNMLVAQMEQSVLFIEEDLRAISSVPSDNADGTVIVEKRGNSNPSIKIEDKAELPEVEPVVSPAIELLSVVTADDSQAEMAAGSVTEKLAKSLALTDEIEPDPAEAAAQEVSVTPPINESSRSFGKLWYAARKAAKSGHHQRAVELYLQMTSSYPDRADGFGELGNVYYAMDDRRHALEMYQQVLKIYQTAGYSGQAQQIQRMISKIQ